MPKKVNFNFYKNNWKLDCLKMLMFISYRITYISNQVRDQYIPGFSCVNISQLFNPFPSVKNAPSYYSHQIIIKKSSSLFEICFLLNDKNYDHKRYQQEKRFVQQKKNQQEKRKYLVSRRRSAKKEIRRKWRWVL